MKVTLQQEPVYTLVAGNLTISGLREVSRWEGLRKLENDDGSLIVMDERGGATRALEDAWNVPGQVVVVAGSPEWLAKLRDARAL